MLLITGANGFLGKHLVEVCKDLRPLAPRSSELNLLNFQEVQNYLSLNRVTRIIHAAGIVGGIELHKEHPGRIAADNLRMGLNVIEAAGKFGDVRVLIVSTVCVYPVNAPIPTPESSMHDGYPAADTAFYGIVKRSLHELAEAMRMEFGLSYITVIPTNLYGPGDHYDETRSHVVPALIRRAHDAKLKGDSELVVWGDGSQVRDFLFAPDCAFWLRKAIESDLDGEALNFGSKIGTSIRALAETICNVVGYEGKIVWDVSKPIGAPWRLLDVSRAEQTLCYSPATTLDEGLVLTYRDYLNRLNRDC